MHSHTNCPYKSRSHSIAHTNLPIKISLLNFPYKSVPWSSGRILEVDKPFVPSCNVLPWKELVGTFRFLSSCLHGWVSIPFPIQIHLQHFLSLFAGTIVMAFKPVIHRLAINNKTPLSLTIVTPTTRHSVCLCWEILYPSIILN